MASVARIGGLANPPVEVPSLVAGEESVNSKVCHRLLKSGVPLLVSLI